jgi:GNAT superfamily N-acetyltransferase
MVTVRDMTPADRPGIAALDTSFETTTIFEVRVTSHRFELVERTLPAPITKRYAIEDVFAPWARWDTGFVAIDGTELVGFAAVELEAWHARLVLWHLYVAPARRRTGVGRALLATVEALGRTHGAERVWLETSNINVPGIAAYARLGYALCGGDTTEYDTLDYADEAALYLAKRLT